MTGPKEHVMAGIRQFVMVKMSSRLVYGDHHIEEFSKNLFLEEGGNSRSDKVGVCLEVVSCAEAEGSSTPAWMAPA